MCEQGNLDLTEIASGTPYNDNANNEINSEVRCVGGYNGKVYNTIIFFMCEQGKIVLTEIGSDRMMQLTMK